MTTEKLFSKIYKLLFKLYANGNSQTLYVKHILNILDNIGLSCIFRNQMLVNIIGIKTHVKQILIDQFIQNWRSEIGNSSRCHLYSLLKQEFCIEPYLLRLEQKYIIYITKFRLSNIRIPIETKCSKDVIGDE
jgi:hypothetical protein